MGKPRDGGDLQASRRHLPARQEDCRNRQGLVARRRTRHLDTHEGFKRRHAFLQIDHPPVHLLDLGVNLVEFGVNLLAQFEPVLDDIRMQGISAPCQCHHEDAERNQFARRELIAHHDPFQVGQSYSIPTRACSTKPLIKSVRGGHGNWARTV